MQIHHHIQDPRIQGENWKSKKATQRFHTMNLPETQLSDLILKLSFTMGGGLSGLEGCGSCLRMVKRIVLGFRFREFRACTSLGFFGVRAGSNTVELYSASTFMRVNILSSSRWCIDCRYLPFLPSKDLQPSFGPLSSTVFPVRSCLNRGWG